MPPTKKRHLKVYPKYFTRAHTWRPVIFPEIRLSGKWLQDIGFAQSQIVEVHQEPHKITVTLKVENNGY